MKQNECFDTREKLLEMVEKAILQTENGQYQLSLSSEEDDLLGEEVIRLRQYKISVEQKLKELEQKAAMQQRTIDELNQCNPQELQEKIKQYAMEKAEWNITQEALKKEVEPLREELAHYREKERDEIIRQSLHSAAARQGIRPEALRDVERLRPLLSIEEDGLIKTADGLTVEKLVEKEKALSPHWLPVSRGGGSQTVTGSLVDLGKETRFETARQNNDITGMILNAPVIE